jgi:hypothetical protein
MASLRLATFFLLFSFTSSWAFDLPTEIRCNFNSTSPTPRPFCIAYAKLFPQNTLSPSTLMVNCDGEEIYNQVAFFQTFENGNPATIVIQGMTSTSYPTPPSLVAHLPESPRLPFRIQDVVLTLKDKKQVHFECEFLRLPSRLF